MKNKKQIQKQLEQQYKHRILLRYERKLKHCCKNCKKSHVDYFDLGQFGKHEKYTCSLHDGKINCQFECKYTEQDIEREMLNDISNPSICGAKQPKIAALLWVLHDDQQNTNENNWNEIQDSNSQLKEVQKKSGFFSRMWRLFQ